ncbi:MAG: hypothetical protein ABSG78_05525 [Verrucomicrobiota bacterium]
MAQLFTLGGINTRAGMLPSNKTNTIIDLACGIVLQIAGGVLVELSGIATIPGLVFVALGAGFFILGCTGYAAAKGYSKWIGLLGSGSLLGLIILVLLPEHVNKPDDYAA